MNAAGEAVHVDGVVHRYGETLALDGVSLTIATGSLVGLIGPDGAGKSTLLGALAGARRIQAGRVWVLGGDMADRSHRLSACPRIAYLPQGLGGNLYAELTVCENIDFFGRLFGQSLAERQHRMTGLLAATGLVAFGDRQAKKLSGGMKQKLGLCCALIHDPELLILDEPTTGVDPLSRRQFWQLISAMRADRPEMTVVVATAYMEEAERFDWIVAMNAGRVFAAGQPADLKIQTGTPTLDAAFTALLSPSIERHTQLVPGDQAIHPGAPAIIARNLTRRFGEFVAVDRVNLDIGPGEIFGFVGSNGCGKTTTMKMLAGLLPPTEGEARMFGEIIDGRRLDLRRRVGYMSQLFSLYSELTVAQNLALHARLFGLATTQSNDRLAELAKLFDLDAVINAPAADLPLGVRQRLSLAVAIVHRPSLLILDEPTSGVDPAARDRLWQHLIDLSRNHGVTIFISTHFMNEAARCDRVALMHAGKILATGPPQAVAAAAGATTLEEAFIRHLESLNEDGMVGPATVALSATSSGAAPSPWQLGLQRLVAIARCETLEVFRDPIRLAVSCLGTILLMLVFGYGITMDVEGVRFAALDRDQTPQSREYLDEFQASRYFRIQPPLRDADEMDRALQSGRIALALEIPPGFGRGLKRGSAPEVAAWIDGAMPFRAETTAAYVIGVHRTYLARVAADEPVSNAAIETRFLFNQDFRSVYAMVPATIAILLCFIPAMLTALAVVRDKEMGPIVNLYVTPVRRVEFLLGKQLPYIGVGVVNFACLVLLAVVLFGVPVKGSLGALTIGALLYVAATTAVGLVVSAFARTQIAAQFGTAIIVMMPATQFSGMLVPVSSLSGVPALIGNAFPTSHFLSLAVGTFTKALTLEDVAMRLLLLAAFFPALLAMAVVLLPKQER